MTARIRPVEPDDWSRWRAIRLRALDEDAPAFACSAHAWLDGGDTEQRWRERIAAPGRLFLATMDGRDVAMIGLAPGDEPELISMWVAPEARRSGIGVALVETVVREAGARALSLRVMALNAGAIAFYERCGFVLTGDPVDDEGTLTMRRDGPTATTTWSPPAERPRRPGGPPPARSADQ
ncbi:GNAT family N-acetyltransferase [Aeromicrobium choanae]|uniref:Ribosomal protein S18 acetylase RimI n=1 Tax=Aeromicrobium choanae TaxID=1736691 RepID=A0A1T4YLU4_9ACTN|nr:GNAT family N-acetyltransferase [Aeromicrobium choanae]SKB02732.1 Ribosomal protein S18 acetylase RimI [Aeromicrobium choanae]